MQHQLDSKTHHSRQILLSLLFIVVLVLGLLYAKWVPYFQKSFVAASTHNIGNAIVGNGHLGKALPWFSLSLGWNFTKAYFLAIYKAFIVALLVGSLVQVLLPVRTIRKYMGGDKFSNSFWAMLMGVPTMMCTCCTAPVAVGLKRSKASTRSVVSFFLANPLLNPATLIFMGFVLGWNYTIFRLIMGIIVVLLVSWFISKVAKEKMVNVPDNKMFDPIEYDDKSLFTRWLEALGKLMLESIPAYVVIVFILGCFQGLIFPAVANLSNNPILGVIGLAILGTLFVIPTAGEIPIIQTLLALGLAPAFVGTLIIALPALSIVSLSLIKPAFSWKSVSYMFCAVVVMSIISGILGAIIL